MGLQVRWEREDRRNGGCCNLRVDRFGDGRVRGKLRRGRGYGKDHERTEKEAGSN